MLREGLAAEFPFAPRVLLSIRRAGIAREHPRWAGVSGFGAAWLVVTGGQAVATLIRVAGFRDPAAWVAGALTVLGVAVGAAVALRAGGRRGLYWYVGGLVAVAGLTLAAQLPAYGDICSRQLLLECSPLQLVLPHLRTLGGLLLGPVAVRFVTSGASGTNPVLNAAGAFALTQPVCRDALAPDLVRAQRSDPGAGGPARLRRLRHARSRCRDARAGSERATGHRVRRLRRHDLGRSAGPVRLGYRARCVRRDQPGELLLGAGGSGGARGVHDRMDPAEASAPGRGQRPGEGARHHGAR